MGIRYYKITHPYLRSYRERTRTKENTILEPNHGGRLQRKFRRKLRSVSLPVVPRTPSLHRGKQTGFPENKETKQSSQF